MIDLSHIQSIGENLARPECVLATKSGHLHVADWRGGVTVIAPDGRQKTVLAKGNFVPKPNGIAILEDGWLLAHLGTEEGGVFHLSPDGACRPFLTHLDGRQLPPTNYPHVDGLGRVWITVSTRKVPRDLGYRQNAGDGFIVMVQNGQARIVADGLGYTNECLVHPEDGRLYVNETFARRLSRFDISEDGSLKNKHVVAEFGAGTYPDGLCFDAEGGIWITSIVSNRVIRVDRDGRQHIMLEDVSEQHLNWTEDAYQSNSLGRPHLDTLGGRKLKNISSLAFGGADLKTAFVGCLGGDHLISFETPVAGIPPYHWNIRHD